MTSKQSASRYFAHLRDFQEHYEAALPSSARYFFVRLLQRAAEVGWGKPLSIPNCEAMRWAAVTTSPGLRKMRASLVEVGVLELVAGKPGRASLYSIVIDKLSTPEPPTTVSPNPQPELPPTPNSSFPLGVTQVSLMEEAKASPSLQTTPDARAHERVQFNTDAQQGIFDVTGCPPFFDCPKMSETLKVAFEAGVTVEDVVAECKKAVPRMGVGTYSIRRFIPTIKQMAVVAEGKKPVSMLDKYSGPEHDAAYKRLMGGKA